MFDANSGDALSFNGEIYNYLELKSNLISEGHSFDTESDTEVLLKLIGAYGIESVTKLNGMFAFVYFSQKQNVLYFVRDSLGKKPLYVVQEKLGVRWSSCLDSLKEKREKCEEFVLTFLSLGYALDPVTPFSEIFSILPGEICALDLGTGQFSTSKKINESAMLTNDETELRQILEASLLSRVEGHGNVAISLSGGVDSSVLAIELSKLNLKAEAFSAVWNDSDKERYNIDSVVAENLCKRLGITFNQVDMVRTKEIPSELQKFVFAMQEPNNNPTGVSMMKLYEAIAKKGNRLAITGDGSDEIFGGYERYSAVNRIPHFLRLNPKKFSKMYFANRMKFIDMSSVLSSQVSPTMPFTWLKWHWNFTPSELQFLLKTNLSPNQIYNKISELVMRLSPTHLGMSHTEVLMRGDHKIWIPMESNRKLDRVSMHFSIEARSPFQDERVIEWAHNYMKINKYKKLGKAPLWESYPELISLGVRKDKAGFTSPVGHWLRGNPDLVRGSLSYLASTGSFNVESLSKFLDAPHRGNYRELMQLWTLIVLSVWLQGN